jgi:hypothetical protein
MARTRRSNVAGSIFTTTCVFFAASGFASAFASVLASAFADVAAAESAAAAFSSSLCGRKSAGPSSARTPT